MVGGVWLGDHTHQLCTIQYGSTKNNVRNRMYRTSTSYEKRLGSKKALLSYIATLGRGHNRRNLSKKMAKTLGIGSQKLL